MSDQTSDRVAMLELDPAPSTAPKAPAAPALPMWAAATIEAIRAIAATGCAQHTQEATRGALEAAVAPIRRQPEGPAKDAVRAALRAAEAQIKAHFAARATAPASVAAEGSRPVAAESAQEPADGTLGGAAAPVEALTRDLANIAEAGAANAAVASLGSMAGGELRGVGFSSAAGYVTALAHGVKAATATQYKSVLASQYDYTAAQLAALTVTIIPEAGLPVGQGTKFVPEGPSVFDAPKSQRKAFKVAGGSDATQKRATLTAGDLIGGSLLGGAGGDFSWHGAGKVERAQLLTALAEIGREGDAPSAKSAHAQAGRAVATLRAQGYHVHTVQGTERRTLPSYVRHRYIVGRASTTGAQIGDAYGTRVLVVDLHDDDTLHTTGQSDLAADVRADFEARCAADVYTSADLTTWLQSVLYHRHGASRFGVGWYVPHGQVADAERLTRAVATIWGSSWRHGMPVASCSHLVEGLTEGIDLAVEALAADWNAAKEAARTERKLAPSERKACAVLRDAAEIGERIRGYAVLLGDDAVAPLKAKIAALVVEVTSVAGDTMARAAMLEFS